MIHELGGYGIGQYALAEITRFCFLVIIFLQIHLCADWMKATIQYARVARRGFRICAYLLAMRLDCSFI